MRAHGQFSELPEIGATDHVCWVYAGEGDLDVAVGRLLDGALSRGERVLGVGEAVIESLDRESVRYGGSGPWLPGVRSRRSRSTRPMPSPRSSATTGSSASTTPPPTAPSPMDSRGCG